MAVVRGWYESDHHETGLFTRQSLSTYLAHSIQETLLVFMVHRLCLVKVAGSENIDASSAHLGDGQFDVPNAVADITTQGDVDMFDSVTLPLPHRLCLRLYMTGPDLRKRPEVPPVVVLLD